MILTADALAFDMDGTLVDSHAVIIAVWTEWAERRGVAPAEVLEFCHGRPLHRTIAHFAVDADPVTEARWVLSRLPEREDMLRPVAGAPAFLASLAPHEWALVTSAPADLAYRWMGICGLPLPDIIITADDVDCPKPDPQPFTLAAQRLGHHPNRMIAFEDATAGLTSAQAAGMQTIGIGGAAGSAASLPDYLHLSRQPGPTITLTFAR